LALIGTPFFSGFYSKDSIIAAVGMSQLPGADFAYFAVTAGVFVTAFYSFRMYFLVFHGEERFGKVHHDHHDNAHEHHGLAPGEKPHETSWVITLPLILLAIPSVLIGIVTIEPLLFGNYFLDAINVAPEHRMWLERMGEAFRESRFEIEEHALLKLPFWFAFTGVFCAWYFYMKRPDIPALLRKRFGPVYTLLDNKYYFDRFNDWFFAGGARGTSNFLWKVGDIKLIDGVMVNGTAKLVGLFSGVLRKIQSGYIYHYAFSMIIGVFVLLTVRNWFE